jgi:hypothetical protein
MTDWNDARFNKRYRKFYILLCVLAGCFFIYAYFGFKDYARIHRHEVFLWDFNGKVDSLKIDDKSTLYIHVNGTEFHLKDYNTRLNNSDLRSSPIIQNGDSVLKIKNSFDIKLIKWQTRNTKILHCYLDTLYYR